MKSVYIYSTYSVLSLGLQSILSADFSVQGVFDSLESLDDGVSRGVPDLLVVEMDSLVTFDTLRDLATKARGSSIILWTDTFSAEFVSGCLGLGIRGVLAKTASEAAHLRCMHEVAGGNLWIDSELSSSLMGVRQVRLSPREQQLVSLLMQGLSNKEISWSMGITTGTVKVYLSRLFPKIGVSDRFELALLALRNMPGLAESMKSEPRKQGEPAKIFAFPDVIRIASGPQQAPPAPSATVWGEARKPAPVYRMHAATA